FRRVLFRSQPKEDAISIATLLVTVFGNTVSLYSEDCCSNLSQDGILTTLVSIFSSHNASCALIARLTSDPVASNIASIFSFSLLLIYATFCTSSISLLLVSSLVCNPCLVSTKAVG